MVGTLEEAAPVSAASCGLRDPYTQAQFPPEGLGVSLGGLRYEDCELRLGPTVALALCACGQGPFLLQVLADISIGGGLQWD